MKFHQFIMLTDVERLQAIWNAGEYIGKRSEGSCTVTLYQLASFYVEVFFCTTKQTLVELRSFIDTNQLLPYTATVDISALKRA